MLQQYTCPTCGAVGANTVGTSAPLCHECDYEVTMLPSKNGKIIQTSVFSLFRALAGAHLKTVDGKLTAQIIERDPNPKCVLPIKVVYSDGVTEWLRRDGRMGEGPNPSRDLCIADDEPSVPGITIEGLTKQLAEARALNQKLAKALRQMSEVFDSDTARRMYTSVVPEGWTSQEVMACADAREVLNQLPSDGRTLEDENDEIEVPLAPITINRQKKIKRSFMETVTLRELIDKLEDIDGAYGNDPEVGFVVYNTSTGMIMTSNLEGEKSGDVMRIIAAKDPKGSKRRKVKDSNDRSEGPEALFTHPQESEPVEEVDRDIGSYRIRFMMNGLETFQLIPRSHRYQWFQPGMVPCPEDGGPSPLVVLRLTSKSSDPETAYLIARYGHNLQKRWYVQTSPASRPFSPAGWNFLPQDLERHVTQWRFL